jgi:hypothetical protein
MRRSALRDRLRERLVSGLLGALFGAAIGVALARVATFGGHGAPPTPAAQPADFRGFARTGALVFGLAGLLLGGRAGGLVGSVPGAMLRSERPSELAVPRWLLVVVTICTAAVVRVRAWPH